jgi:hypothetical protein
MSNRPLVISERIAATLGRQLCSNLLHNCHFVSDREVGRQ